MSRRFYVDGRAQYLKVNISNLDGSLGIYEFDVLYRYRPNVSFAVGYTDFTANITSTKILVLGPFEFDGGTILFPLAYIFGDVLTDTAFFLRQTAPVDFAAFDGSRLGDAADFHRKF